MKKEVWKTDDTLRKRLIEAVESEVPEDKRLEIAVYVATLPYIGSTLTWDKVSKGILTNAQHEYKRKLEPFPKVLAVAEDIFTFIEKREKDRRAEDARASAGEFSGHAGALYGPMGL